MHEVVHVNYLRWIVLLPLLGAILNGLSGSVLQKRLGKGVISLIGCASVFAAFGISVVAFIALWRREPADRLLLDHLFTWIHIGNMKIEMAFQVDPLSAVMILVVTGVGGLIHLYSTGYMHEEAAYWRFFAYLNLFTAMMLTLVLGDNILLMFVGWEGVGLCSYALIGFWYKEWANASAGSKAFIVNRVGDFGFMLGTFLLFWTIAGQGHPTLTFRELAEHIHLLDGQTLSLPVFGTVAVATVITLLLFVGATGKSAQIPLYVWLPDAMAGPTPVSALIHAATMVTAGVYMIGRLSFLFSLAPPTLTVIAWIGALTALFSATIGTSQFDIKRVLAYSTVSQLGYMFLAMGSGAYSAGIFHLVTHAFFKACLFLGSGSVIHAMHHEQDMRKMGGLKKRMPVTFVTFTISAAAIAGAPLLSGFFSKDEILWKAWESGHQIPWLMGFLAAGLTAFYMFRQVFMTFFGECRADHHTQEHLHESPATMTVPLIILAALAVVGGFLNVPASLSFLGGNHFDQWLAPVFEAGHHDGHGHDAHHEIPPIEYGLMALSIMMATVGFSIAWLMYYKQSISPERVSRALGRLYTAVYNKYYVDELYEATVVRGTLRLTELAAWFDQNVIDAAVNAVASVTRVASNIGGLLDHYIVDGVVNGVGAVTTFVGGRVRRLQTGNINAYLYVIAIAVVSVMVMRLM